MARVFCFRAFHKQEYAEKKIRQSREPINGRQSGHRSCVPNFVLVGKSCVRTFKCFEDKQGGQAKAQGEEKM